MSTSKIIEEQEITELSEYMRRKTVFDGTHTYRFVWITDGLPEGRDFDFEHSCIYHCDGIEELRFNGCLWRAIRSFDRYTREHAPCRHRTLSYLARCAGEKCDCRYVSIVDAACDYKNYRNYTVEDCERALEKYPELAILQDDCSAGRCSKEVMVSLFYMVIGMTLARGLRLVREESTDTEFKEPESKTWLESWSENEENEMYYYYEGDSEDEEAYNKWQHKNRYNFTGTVSVKFLAPVSSKKVKELEEKMKGHTYGIWKYKNKNRNLTFKPSRGANAPLIWYKEELENLLNVLKGYVKVTSSTIKYQHKYIKDEGEFLVVNKNGQVRLK